MVHRVGASPSANNIYIAVPIKEVPSPSPVTATTSLVSVHDFEDSGCCVYFVSMHVCNQ